MPPARTERPPARRRALAALGLALAAACARAPERLEPVPPADPGALDPLVAETIQRPLAAARAAPGSAEAHGDLAIAYDANQLWPEARASYDHAAALDPSQPLWPYRAAVARAQEGDFDGALERLRAVVRAFPDYAPGRARLGETLLEKGRVDEAEPELARARALEPARPEPLVGLARVQLERRDWETARTLLESALAMDAGYQRAHFLLAQAYRGLGRVEDAAREAELGAGLDKRSLPDAAAPRLASYAAGLSSLLDRANALLGRGETGAAIVLLEGALKRRPESVEIGNTLAVAYKRAGQPERSLALLEALRARAPDDVGTLVNLTETHIARGDLAAAWPVALRAAELAPQDKRALFAEGRVLLFQERWGEALGPLQAALRAGGEDPDVRLALAEGCMHLGLVAEAAEHYERAAERMPDSLPVQVSLAAVRLRLGDVPGARVALRAARRIDPDHERVRALERELAGRGG